MFSEMTGFIVSLETVFVILNISPFHHGRGRAPDSGKSLIYGPLQNRLLSFIPCLHFRHFISTSRTSYLIRLPSAVSQRGWCAFNIEAYGRASLTRSDVLLFRESAGKVPLKRLPHCK